MGATAVTIELRPKSVENAANPQAPPVLCWRAYLPMTFQRTASGSEHNLLFLLDSGTDISSIPFAVAKKAGFHPSSPDCIHVNTTHGTYESYLHHVTLRFPNITRPISTVVGVQPNPSRGAKIRKCFRQLRDWFLRRKALPSEYGLLAFRDVIEHFDVSIHKPRPAVFELELRLR